MAEKLDVPDIIEAARFKINQNRPGNIAPNSPFIVVDIDPFQLKVARPFVFPVGIYPMLF